MIIGIDPVVVSVGALAVRWFGLLALLGVGAGVWLAVREARRRGLPAGVITGALAWALPLGVLGARVVHVLGWWDYYFIRPGELGRLNLDELSLWGGLTTGAVVVALRLRRSPLRRRLVFDAAAPAVLVAIAIGRVGAFLDGHGQGLPAEVAWATRYTNPLAASPDFGVSRHPAQLYDALACGLIVLLLQLVPRAGPAGSRAVLAALLYAGAREVLGGVRLDPAFLFGLQIEQLLAGAWLVVGAWAALRLVRRRPLPEQARPPAQEAELAA